MSGNRRRARLNDIARIAGALREPVETPDFTVSILERVHAEKPFTSAKTRRWIPLVRISSACVAVLAVFAVTLIVFVHPSLPEELGAAPSVTTDLVQSAEDGVASKVEGVIKSMQLVRQAADVRILRPMKALARAEKGGPAGSPIPIEAGLELDPSVLDPGQPMIVTLASFPVPDSTPVMVDYPAVPPEMSDYAAFTKASFVDSRFGTDERSAGIPWQRAAMVSQPWVGRAAYIPTFAPSSLPRLNSDSPMLLKELIPMITGQSAGDDLQIR